MCLFLEVLASFASRDDNQIMSLEILSIAFGLSVFAELVRGRNVHVHSDNVGAQHCTDRGYAKTFDHTCLVHGIWFANFASFRICILGPLVPRMRALELGTGLFVSRVPTKENLADDPSRERYSLLEMLGAVRMEPFLHHSFELAQTWNALSVRRADLSSS